MPHTSSNTDSDHADRYCLNIKGLPYKTVWVEFPDIAPLCKKLGAPGSETRRDGSQSYTVPFIYDPSTQTYVAGSDAIARYLDRTYPDTARVVPKDTEALHAAFQHSFSGLLLGRDMLSIMIPAVHDALNPASQAYFRKTREKRFGKLEELAPAGSEKRAKHWQGVKNAFHTIGTWMNVDGEELLFLGGNKVCQADLGVAAGTIAEFSKALKKGSKAPSSQQVVLNLLVLGEIGRIM